MIGGDPRSDMATERALAKNRRESTTMGDLTRWVLLSRSKFSVSRGEKRYLRSFAARLEKKKSFRSSICFV